MIIVAPAGQQPAGGGHEPPNMGNTAPLRPTTNTSPLAPHVHSWAALLAHAHSHTCNAGKDHCTGMRTTQEVCATEFYAQATGNSPPQCDQALEAEQVLHIIYHGAPIIPAQQNPATVPPFEVQNYPTTPQQAAAITADIAAEVAAGILIQVPHKPAHITALATKEEAAGKIRVLRDCSKPDRGAINDYADAQHFQMQGIEEALAHMRPFAYMAKVDIKAAFRTVGIHPAHWHLLGFQWKNPPQGEAGGSSAPRYYIDTRCPFGLKCSPEIFCRITAAIKVMLAAHGVRAVVVYVDDFFIIALEEGECARALQLLLRLLRTHLGFTISDPKTVLPTQQLTFVGFDLATNVGGTGGMRITVPEAKLRKAEEMAAQLHGRRTASIKELERAVGFFAHVAYAIYSARCFHRRLTYAITAARAAGMAQVPITEDMRLDLNFWTNLAREGNGTAVILARPILLPGFLATDASDWGMGGFYDDGSGTIRTFSIAWDSLATAQPHPEMLGYHKPDLQPTQLGRPGLWRIEYREQYAMWWAVLTWGPLFRHRHLLWHQDNTIVEANVNRMGAKNPIHMRLLRHLFRVAAREDMRHRATRITSEANILADLLSRGQPREFAQALAARTAGLAHDPTGGPQAWAPRTPTPAAFMTHRAERKRARDAADTDTCSLTEEGSAHTPTGGEAAARAPGAAKRPRAAGPRSHPPEPVERPGGREPRKPGTGGANGGMRPGWPPPHPSRPAKTLPGRAHRPGTGDAAGREEPRGASREHTTRARR